MGDSKEVQTQFGVVEVHKMPLADYAELLKALNNIPKELMGMFNGIGDDKLREMENNDFVSLIPGVLANSWTDLIGVISVATDKDANFISKLDLADAVDVVGAILELNDIKRIMAAIKKMLALQSKIARPTKQKQI